MNIGVYRKSVTVPIILVYPYCMSTGVNYNEEELPFDRAEYDRVALFNALDLTTQQSDVLTAAWIDAGGEQSLPEFVRERVLDGMTAEHS